MTTQHQAPAQPVARATPKEPLVVRAADGIWRAFVGALLLAAVLTPLLGYVRGYEVVDGQQFLEDAASGQVTQWDRGEGFDTDSRSADFSTSEDGGMILYRPAGGFWTRDRLASPVPDPRRTSGVTMDDWGAAAPEMRAAIDGLGYDTAVDQDPLGWWKVIASLSVVAALIWAVTGARPARGTRWFWFWIIVLVPGYLGVAAYLWREHLRPAGVREPRRRGLDGFATGLLTAMGLRLAWLVIGGIFVFGVIPRW